MSSLGKQKYLAPWWIYIGPVLVGEQGKTLRICSRTERNWAARRTLGHLHPWLFCSLCPGSLGLLHLGRGVVGMLTGRDCRGRRCPGNSTAEHAWWRVDREWECRAGGNSAGKKTPNLSCHQDKITSGWDLAWAKPPCSGKPVTSCLLLSYAGIKSALSWGAAGLSTHFRVPWLCGLGHRGQPEWLQAAGRRFLDKAAASAEQSCACLEPAHSFDV